MDRRQFLGLLTLIGCNEDMLLAQHGYLGRQKGIDVIWTIGDSISRGNSDAVGATPTANTVYQWDAGNSNLRMISNTDLLEPVAAGATGSQWPAAGITYHELTHRRPVFVNTGVGGSAFYNPSAGFSWYTNDTLFSASVTKVRNCLTYTNIAAPKFVWICMGINDVVQGHPLSNTYLTSLIDRILAEFPGVRICMTLPYASSVSTYADLTRLYQMRKWIKALCFTYPTVEIAGDLGVIIQFGSTLQGDNIHLNFTGNSFYGDKAMYGICQHMTRSKWTRAFTGAMYSRISETRMNYLDTLISDLGGEFENIDSLEFTTTAGYTDVTNKHKNALPDIGFINVNSILSPVAQFSYDGWSPAGLVDSDRIAVAPLSLIADKALLDSDALFGLYITANAVGATTASSLHAVRESASGAIYMVRQTGSSTVGIVAGCGVEMTNGTDTRPTADHFWGAARDSGNQMIIKDASIVATSAQAATTMSPGSNVRSCSLGNYNNNGTIQQRWAGKVTWRILAKYSTMNKTTVMNAMSSFMTNWLQNIT
jgi:hypothetical protein